MKHLIRIIFTVFAIAIIYSCRNDGGTSPVIKKDRIYFLDFNVYYGSPQGAQQKIFDTVRIVDRIVVQNKDSTIYKDTIYLEIDSLYREYCRVQYFPAKYKTVRDDMNVITFEFMGDDGKMLTFTKGGTKIISSYTYKNDSLCILKGGDEPVYVARKDAETRQFYRRALLYRYMNPTTTEEGKEILEDNTIIVDEVVYNLKDALKYAGFDTPESFTNPKDTIAWCNVLYTYR